MSESNAARKRELFPEQERIGRWVGLVVFGGAALRQILAAPPPGSERVEWVRWALITILFLLFFAAYLRRAHARGLATRPIEIWLPLLVASIVFWQGGPPSWITNAFRAVVPGGGEWIALAFRPLPRIAPLHTGLVVMALGEVLTVAGMLYLGRSFSLFVEARELVTSGPYRWIRHPLYAGELVSVWGFVLEWSNLWSLAIAALVTGLQISRARLEERKLSEHFPEYAEYARRTGFLWPRLGRNAAPG